MKRRILPFLVSLCGFCTYLHAQKPLVASGEYIYYPPSTQSLDEAKQAALQRAQVQILADKFGTVVNMSSTVVVDSSSPDIDMLQLSESTVRGEWLETLGMPVFTTGITERGLLFIKVYVKGKIRKITDSKADFVARVLRNGTEDRCESTDFKSGDDLFISFIAPVDGFLTIYLYDGKDDVFCLLPYQSQNIPVFKVIGGKKYTLFSTVCAEYGMPEDMIDEYSLTCSGSMEMNRIYVIWSPDNYYRASDFMCGESLPRSLNLAEFKQWLSKLRAQNRNVVVKQIDIVIREI